MLWVIIVTASDGYKRAHETITFCVEDLVTEKWAKWNGFGKIPFINYHQIRQRDKPQYITMWAGDNHYIMDPIIMTM